MPFTSGLKPKVRKNSDVVLLGGVLLLTRKRINRSLESLNRNESGFAQ